MAVWTAVLGVLQLYSVFQGKVREETVEPVWTPAPSSPPLCSAMITWMGMGG